MIFTESVRSASVLAYNGDFQSAISALGGRWRGVGVEPARNGEGDAEYAALLLACGILSVEVARFSLLPSQAQAKDLLTKAATFFGDDPAAEEARLWLAMSYLWCGENVEALALVDSILSAQIAESRVVFSAGMVKSLCYLYLGNLERADQSLREVQVLLDTVSPLARGKFYLNRGMLRRRMGDQDAALLDYAMAIPAFQEAGSLRYEAATQNNCARIYAETGMIAEAHEAARLALARFRKLGDKAHEAKVLDEIAQIYAREGQYAKMEQLATEAVTILSAGDHQGWLAEALITQGTARAHLGIEQAQTALFKALEICDRQNDLEQADAVTAAMWALVQRGKQMGDSVCGSLLKVERTVYERVLDKHNGRVSPAARELGCLHQSLNKRLATRFPDLVAKQRPKWPRNKSLVTRQR